MSNYEKLVDRISKSSNLPKEEIERKIEAKKAKLSGLISKEGAAQIVAAELGINFDQERLKISELIQGMKRANVIGKIIQLNPVRSFNKNGKEGKVASFLLADESSNIRTVFWDTNHISLIETGKLKENSVIEISNAGVRNGELHLSSFADVKESKETIDKVIAQRVFQEKKLKDARPGEDLSTRAVIVKAFEPRYFEVCPECGKKAVENQCNTHGTIKAVKKALLNIILDDGTETIRTVIFGDQINSLGLTNEQIFSLDEYNKVKNNILGEEMSFIGQIRNNALYNTTEFTIQEIKLIDPNELVKQLETKA
jgi:ssDNA-binding replication factor A large subunit